MADVSIHDDQVFDVVAPQAPVQAVDSRESALPRQGFSRTIAVLLSVGSSATFIAYFVWGSVRIEAGTRAGVRYRIATIWADFTSYLVRQGASPELTVLVSVVAAVSVLGSCLLIGLAFAARDEIPDAE